MCFKSRGGVSLCKEKRRKERNSNDKIRIMLLDSNFFLTLFFYFFLYFVELIIKNIYFILFFIMY